MAWSGLANTSAFGFIKNQAVALVGIAQAAIVFNKSVDKTSSQCRSGCCLDPVRCVFMRVPLDLSDDTSAQLKTQAVLNGLKLKKAGHPTVQRGLAAISHLPEALQPPDQ